MPRPRKTDTLAAASQPAAVDTDDAQAARQPYDQRDYRDRVAMRAYELYLARGGADGGDFDDWLAAEREITSGADTDPADAADSTGPR